MAKSTMRTGFRIFITLISTLAVYGVMQQFCRADISLNENIQNVGSHSAPGFSTTKDPNLPQTFLNTSFKQPSGKTIVLAEGGDLQSAINRATPGDTIVLKAGVNFTAPSGGFVLSAKPESRLDEWIIIRTSQLDALPVGRRVDPDKQSSAMPRIVALNNEAVVRTEQGAHNYRFVGIEFTVDSSVMSNTGLIRLGDSDETDISKVPHDIIIDRCYIHGNKTGAMRRGVALNSARTAVIDSYISEFHDSGQDTQAICGWNGPGPFKIVNNYLEATGENVMFGGADPSIKNLTPSDIEFRQNYCFKPLAWRNANAPNKWVTKNLFELKNARRVLVEGNTFENSWVSGQTGFAILFKSSNQDGKAPWSITEHITFKNNIIRHASSGVNILGREHDTDRVTNNILIANNLFDDIDGKRWGGSGIFLQITESPNVRVDHNTVFQSGNVITVYGVPSTDFAFTNNLIRHNAYGVKGDARGSGNDTIKAYFPDGTFSNNVIAGLPGDVSPSSYPPGNFFPTGSDNIKFVGGTDGNYRLGMASPFKSAATDGKAVGYDPDEIEKAKQVVSTQSSLQSGKSN